MGTRRHDPPGGASGSLAQLLATEARLDAAVAEARERAATRVAEARTRAAALIEGLAAELAALDSGRTARRDDELARRRAEIEIETDRIVGRFEGLSDREVDAWADWLVERVLAP